MLFFLCCILTLWLLVWVSKAAEVQLTAQEHAEQLKEIAAALEELNRKV